MGRSSLLACHFSLIALSASLRFDETFNYKQNSRFLEFGKYAWSEKKRNFTSTQMEYENNPLMLWILFSYFRLCNKIDENITLPEMRWKGVLDNSKEKRFCPQKWKCMEISFKLQYACGALLRDKNKFYSKSFCCRKYLSRKLFECKLRDGSEYFEKISWRVLFETIFGYFRVAFKIYINWISISIRCSWLSYLLKPYMLRSNLLHFRV